ncbi:MAG: TonB-dependent receptor [Candidatus Hydrogenedens sp.]|nr:TonB-dependent receptor [Candidatus Hydrogenedens sp.]
MQAQSTTIQKALELNLDPCKYGTIAEIGAGQEVARFFFQAGGAAGSIAKTISAYDMQVSDAIYGVSEDRRYVSRKRLEAMLGHEFNLLVQRIGDIRPKNSTFFVYADTVAARGYQSKRECHGWCGVRVQLYPKAEPSDIIVHVRMLDDENRQQQEALGMLGVNVIHGAFFGYREPEKMIESFIDNIGAQRLEIDMVHLSGPYFEEVDNRLLALHLVKAGLTHAALFTPKGEVVRAGDVLHRKNILVSRGSFRPPTLVNMDMVRCAEVRFAAEPSVKADGMITLMELTMAKLMTGGHIDTRDFLDRVDMLGELGYLVLISNYGRFFRLRAYLSRATNRQIGIVLGVDNITDIFNEEYYGELEGGILEAFGKLFPGHSKMYVYPKRGNNGHGLITVDDLELPAHLRHLFLHLRQNGFIEPLDGCDESVMGHFSREILGQLRQGDGDWKDGVPESVYTAIVERRLFGYDSE